MPPIDSKSKVSDGKHGKSKQPKTMANPHVTRMKRERRDTDKSDSDLGGNKANSLKSALSKKNIQLENTYKLEPDEANRFQSHTVKNIAQEVLEDVLKDQEYDANTFKSLAKTIVDKTKEKTKEMKMSRHKIVVHAVIGEKGDQSLKATSRCLWNDKFDSHISAELETKTIFALVTVYGIYFE